MTSYSVLFLSSSEISLPLLEALQKDPEFEIVGLICQPDRPVGRQQFVQKPAPKLHAERYGIPCYQPEKLSLESSLLADLQNHPPDFLLTFSYGQILSEPWLKLPRLEALNVHPSLLPKYRGATPIQSAILNGDAVTGISLMRMLKKMDAGAIFSQMSFPLTHPISSKLLFDDIALRAAQWVPDQLKALAQGKLQPKEQDESLASYTHKIKKEDGFVDFTQSAAQIHHRFNAFTPWPGLWTKYKGLRLKFLDLETADVPLPPGKVQFEKGALFIGTSDGALKIKQLQLEGKQAMHASQFLIGQPEFSSTDLPS